MARGTPTGIVSAANKTDPKSRKVAITHTVKRILLMLYLLACRIENVERIPSVMAKPVNTGADGCTETPVNLWG